jgi:SAM-dependent methyltransferase
VVVARGRDFEYDTSPDEFTARECGACRVVYLDPRPCDDELSRIYPANYHAFDFSAAEFGFVYRVRERLEARRVLGWCRGLPSDARILDIGCGDGFHLDLLRRYGQRSWQLEGIDSDARAVAAAARRGLAVHLGRVEDLALPHASYHLILLIMTIEHVADPANLLATARDLLRPGGRVIVITDNTDSIDRLFARKRYWGGYHFPRHWTLFNPAAMRRLAGAVHLEVASLTTVLSPVNWVYSIRNWLVDRRAPSWLVERFSLKAPLSLALFTIIDQVCVWLGRGAIFRAELRRPITE